MKANSESRFSIFWMLLLPLLIFIYLSLFGIKATDSYLAQLAYLGGGNWIVGKGFWIEQVIHQWGKLIPVFVGVGSFLLFLGSYIPRFHCLKPYRAGFSYVTVSIVVCTLAVVGGKAISSSFCPSNLAEYGGSGLGTGKCYPAGHAGAGFCLYALFFVCLKYCPKYAKAALAAVIALGLIFGISRQLQGAHFLSHTLATMSLDFFLSAAIYILTLGRKSKRRFF